MQSPTAYVRRLKLKVWEIVGLIILAYFDYGSIAYLLQLTEGRQPQWNVLFWVVVFFALTGYAVFKLTRRFRQ